MAEHSRKIGSNAKLLENSLSRDPQAGTLLGILRGFRGPKPVLSWNTTGTFLKLARPPPKKTIRFRENAPLGGPRKEVFREAAALSLQSSNFLGNYYCNGGPNTSVSRKTTVVGNLKGYFPKNYRIWGPFLPKTTVLGPPTWQVPQATSNYQHSKFPGQLLFFGATRSG